MAAKSLSSLDIRFSAAVNVPWDKGDGFRNVAWMEVLGDGAAAAAAGDGAGRADTLDDDDPVR